MREIAERQEGVVARWQLAVAGIDDARIRRWVRDSRLCRKYRGVYTLGHRRLTVRGELIAALFYAGRGAALSHATAAWWWDLTDAEPRRIHVTAPRATPSLPAVKVHRVEARSVIHRGLKVTTAARTVLDVARTAPFHELRKLLAEVEFQGLATISELEAECGRGRPGSAALRRALRMHQPALARTRSALEERWVALCETHGIPMPEMNVMICGLTVDALWRAEGVVVELDGVAGHASAARMERDRRRDLRLRAAGLVVLRYTWSQLTDSAAEIAAEVRGRLA